MRRCRTRSGSWKIGPRRSRSSLWSRGIVASGWSGCTICIRRTCYELGRLMNWDILVVRDAWSGNVSNRAAKEELGRRIAERVQDGEVIGVGSGSTSYIAIHAIAERVRKERLNVTTVCTSQEVTLACVALDLPVASLLQRRPDWAYDGADEVDPERNLIKGRGGAMFMEKIVMHSSPRNFILVDQSKLVTRLGEKFPIPVEILPITLRLVERELAAIGATEIV